MGSLYGLSYNPSTGSGKYKVLSNTTSTGASLNCTNAKAKRIYAKPNDEVDKCLANFVSVEFRVSDRHKFYKEKYIRFIHFSKPIFGLNKVDH